MIYKRGKKHTYWFRFRFAGRIIHESARTQSKTLAREAEQARRRQLELSINGVTGRRALPPTFERAAEQWLEARKHLIRPNTDKMARIALKQVIPCTGKSTPPALLRGGAPRGVMPGSWLASSAAFMICG
ncbi:MAG: hypothetical protein WB630_10865 [Candidatus Acidiferrales bacterium]